MRTLLPPFDEYAGASVAASLSRRHSVGTRPGDETLVKPPRCGSADCGLTHPESASTRSTVAIGSGSRVGKATTMLPPDPVHMPPRTTIGRGGMSERGK